MPGIDDHLRLNNTLKASGSILNKYRSCDASGSAVDKYKVSVKRRSC